MNGITWAEDLISHPIQCFHIFYISIQGLGFSPHVIPWSMWTADDLFAFLQIWKHLGAILVASRSSSQFWSILEDDLPLKRSTPQGGATSGATSRLPELTTILHASSSSTCICVKCRVLTICRKRPAAQAAQAFQSRLQNRPQLFTKSCS